MQRWLGTLNLEISELLFAGLTEVPFSIRDAQLRIIAANQAMARLCGVANPSAMIGTRSVDYLSAESSQRHDALDRQVLLTGWPLLNRFESAQFNNGGSAWLLVTRIPIKDDQGEVVGVAMSGRQFKTSGRTQSVYTRVVKVARKLESSFDEPLMLADLADLAGVSISQLDRDFLNVFGASPKSILQQFRFGRALELLIETDKSVTEIAYECGFSDLSAFNRRFRASVGVNPRAYREFVKVPPKKPEQGDGALRPADRRPELV